MELSDVTDRSATRQRRVVPTPARPHLYRERVRANPKDADAALQYGSALRASASARRRWQCWSRRDRQSQQQGAARRLRAGAGRQRHFQQAFDVLSRAHDPRIPIGESVGARRRARINSTVTTKPQVLRERAEDPPEAPSVLSNLGLSYLLSNELPKAEETLRRAHGKAEQDPRIRTNLAVAVGLQGRVAEAENIVKAGLRRTKRQRTLPI